MHDAASAASARGRAHTRGDATIGWLEATGFVFAIGALSLVYAIGHRMGAHPIAFILYAIVASATATLAFTGLGADAWAMMRHPSSWIVGVSIIAIEVSYFLTLTLVPPAHGNLMLRIGVPLALAAGWTVLGRRPPPLAIGGGVLIVVATAFVVAVTSPDVRWPLAAAGMSAAVFMVVRGFAAEFHPWNRAARTVREKLRVTGVIILVTSLLSLTLTAAAAAAIAGGHLPALRFVPTAEQMLDVRTALLGCFAGGAILTLMFYLNFSSVVKITTENLTAMMAFAPLTSWLFQAIGVELGLIDADAPAPELVVAMAVFVVAVLMVFRAGRHRSGAR